MRLSKQERIAAVVVIVLIILVAGVFLFIKPNIETIIETKATLAAKEKEYNDAVAKANTKDGLRTQILDAYDKGKNLADMFYPELASYEADNEFREFLSTCESNILIDGYEISAPQTKGLSTTVFVPAEVQYALKDYVNQGSTEAADPALERQAKIQAALGGAQTIGATTIEVTVKAIDPNDLLTFADEINRYTKTENGKTIRKSIELSGISFTDGLATFEYELLTDSLIEQAEAAAAKVFKEKTGYNLSGYRENTNTNNTQTEVSPEVGEDGSLSLGGNNGDDDERDVAQFYYEMTCEVTFYSIERMQDPTPTLDDQDRSVNA